jgi:peptidoglycan/LPS O-acetylase OafA/YrhL
MDRAHRNDIDGLRAVAILPVLLYHAAVWPFAGGYVGVDVFFVISGYLITGLILRAEAGAGFSLTNFYDRRIRRILPALFAMLAAACVAALFVLLPDELVLFGRNLLAGVLFCANILDWMHATNYFAADAGRNPLLHLWSLSVEEQFYLVWPVTLIWLARRRRILPAAIAAMAAASLAAAAILSTRDPNFVFYLLPARAWELLLGAFLAAVPHLAPRSAALRNIAGIGGLMLVAATMVFPGRFSGYPFSSTLGAALGTGMFLYASEGGANLASRVLALRVPVFIGRISYALYLWHWPALVFARLYLDRELRPVETAAILAAVFVVSVLSWRTIEEPIRRRRGAAISMRAAAAGSGVLAAVALLFWLTTGLPGRVPPDVRAIDTEAFFYAHARFCDPPRGCTAGNPAFAGEVVLWGDSHAQALAPGLEDFAAKRHLRLHWFTHPSCAPLFAADGQDDVGSVYPACDGFNRDALSAIEASSAAVRLVVLQASWVSYAHRRAVHAVHAVRAARLSDWGHVAYFNQTLDRLLDVLTRRGIPVLLTGNVPNYPNVPAQCYGHEKMIGRDPARCLSMPLAQVQAQTGFTDALLRAAAARHPGVRVFLPVGALCERDLCHALSGGHILYRDNNHLTPAGAAVVGAALDRSLRGWP